MGSAWRASVSLALLLVAACGGGGGGGPPPPQPPQPPAPPAPGGPLTLTESNVLSAASLVMRQIEHTHLAAEGMVITADVLHCSGVSSTTITCSDGVPIYLSNEDHDGSGSLSQGDILRLHFTSCVGLSLDTTMLILALDHAAGTIEGRVAFVVSTDDGVQANGTFHLASVFDYAALELRQTMSDLDVTVTDRSATAHISDAESVRRITGDAYRISLSGNASGSELGGELTFATLAPFSGNAGAVPASGELELAAGASRARISSPATDPALRDDHFVYRVDSTGAGDFSTERHGRWSEIVAGFMFDWDANIAPEITSLTLGPADPTVRDVVTASYSATDVDGDALTYYSEWRVNDFPLLIGVNETTLPLAEFHKGDVITFVLRVSDSRAMAVATASVTIANSPPHDATASLEPAVPRTTDDLLVRYGVQDADGDHPEATFEWLRDGIPIPGQTGRLLPHTEHAKGQEITAVVHFSDGEAVVSASASVTIADTPPIVVVPTDYDPVPYGGTLTFDVTAFDVDGDSLGQFVLSYGPAGMTLDPSTGRVSWPVQGPAFETDVAMNYGVTLDRPNAPVARGTVWLRSPGREKPLLATGTEAPVASGIVAGDFDGDGEVSLLVAGENLLYELEWTGTGLRQSWVYPLPFDEPLAALAAADVDGDGRHEIFVGHGNSVTKLDGATRLPVAIVSTGDYKTRGVEIADVDADGKLDLVTIASLHGSDDPVAEARVLRATAASFGPFFDYRVQGSAIAIGDVDGDSDLEIVTNGGDVFHVFNWLGRWRHPTPFGRRLAVGDLDGDGIDEIVASADDGSLRAYEAGTEGARWVVENVDADVVVTADAVGDAGEEILVGGGPGGNGLVRIYAQTAPDAAALVDASAAVGDDVRAIATGDVDGDGESELVWGSSTPGAAITIAGGAPLDIEWTTADLSYGALLGPYVGGQLARRPGDAAVLFATTRSGFGGARLIGMDATTGDLSVGLGQGAPGNGNFALTVADYDGDGTDEALLASSSSDTAYLRAYDFFGDAIDWEATFPSALNGVAIAQGDLTGDARPEVAAIDEDGVVRAYEIGSGSPFWTGPTLTNGRDIAIAELNGGGWPEIVVAAADRVYVFSRDGSASYAQTHVSASPLPGLRDIEIGDVDGDGVLEIFALYGLEGTVPPTSVQRLDATLSVQGGFDYWRWARGLTIERSVFPRKNLVFIEKIEGDQIVVVDSDSGDEIWESPTLLGSIARDGVHFVDVDGVLRIAVATSLGMYLTR